MGYKSRIRIFSIVTKDVLLKADARGMKSSKKGLDPWHGGVVRPYLLFPSLKSGAPFTTIPWPEEPTSPEAR